MFSSAFLDYILIYSEEDTSVTVAAVVAVFLKMANIPYQVLVTFIRGATRLETL